jgi:tetrahydromethanopterin S-methyltransferase subunit G
MKYLGEGMGRDIMVLYDIGSILRLCFVCLVYSPIPISVPNKTHKY